MMTMSGRLSEIRRSVLARKAPTINEFARVMGPVQSSLNNRCVRVPLVGTLGRVVHEGHPPISAKISRDIRQAGERVADGARPRRRRFHSSDASRTLAPDRERWPAAVGVERTETHATDCLAGADSNS